MGWESKGFKDRRVFRDFKALLEEQDHRVTQVFKDPKGYKDLRVCKDYKVFRAM
jgi:hypothetical protein